MTITKTNGKITLSMILHGEVSEERLAHEMGVLDHRLDQLSPHPKSMEFQRALEEDRE